VTEAQPTPIPEAEAEALEQEADSAQEQVRMGIYISAVRCIITYALIPAISVTGSLAGLLGLVGVGLQILGAAVSTFGAIRLWQLRHRARYLYVAVTACVYIATIFSIIEYAVLRS